jgi:beta-glucanase (GH16 family)
MKKLFFLSIVASAVSNLFAGTVNPYGADSADPPQISGMTLLWHDEFDVDGKPDPLNWKYESGFVRNEELQWYRSDNVNCKDGLLIIEGKREQTLNPNYVPGSTDWKKKRQYAEYTSGSIHTQKLQEFRYGRYEIRARIDTASGSWPAIWAKGASGSWPFCGEIDVMEFYRRNGVPVILANVAWGSATSASGTWNTGRFPLTRFAEHDADWCNRFHVWRMDWTPDSIKLFLDDDLLNVQKLSSAVNPAGSTPSAPFQQKHYFLLNLAIGANGGDPGSSAFPIRYEVDYFRVYQTLADASIPAQGASDAKIYLNPANNLLAIESMKPVRQIVITDISGKEAYRCHNPGNRVDISALNSGVYIIGIVFDGGEKRVQKIIKT